WYMPILAGIMIFIVVLIGGSIASQTKKPNILPTPTITKIVPTKNQPIDIVSPTPTRTPSTIPTPTLTQIPTIILKPTSIPPTSIPQPTRVPPISVPYVPIYIPPTQIPQQVAPQTNSGSGFSCNCGKVCGAMSSCEEAYYQLNTCGCSVRDGDHDGVPCETICPGG
ncbi:MAG: hypothetical protein NTZ55_05710, partial [Candidatus Roizmanbacteria bacterium]|nr:hypothetical protein [Candidatus Roizmanbacteria bacterium]